jgi:hypothetical protein
MQKNIQAKADNELVPKELINFNLQSIQNTLIIYQTYIQHPMIVHHAKRGHVYKVCCEPIETVDMFNQYLTNFNLDSKQGHAMDKFLTKWFIIISFYLKFIYQLFFSQYSSTNR